MEVNKTQKAALAVDSVQTSAQMPGSEAPVLVPAVVIPPVPGGGSWSWTGTKWVSNDKPAPVAIPAVTQE